MRICVKVKPKSSFKKVIRGEDGVYIVCVTEIPQNNKVNIAVQKMLAKHFNVSKSCVSLIQGRKSKIKYFEIIR